MRLSVATTRFKTFPPQTSIHISRVAPQSRADSSDGQVPRGPLFPARSTSFDSVATSSAGGPLMSPLEAMPRNDKPMAVANTARSTSAVPSSAWPLRCFHHGTMCVATMTPPPSSSSSLTSIASLTTNDGSKWTSAVSMVPSLSTPTPPSSLPSAERGRLRKMSSTASPKIGSGTVLADPAEYSAVASAGCHSAASSSVGEAPGRRASAEMASAPSSMSLIGSSSSLAVDDILLDKLARPGVGVWCVLGMGWFLASPVVLGTR